MNNLQKLLGSVSDRAMQLHTLIISILALAEGVYLLPGGAHVKIVEQNGTATKYHVIPRPTTKQISSIQNAMELTRDRANRQCPNQAHYWAIRVSVYLFPFVIRCTNCYTKFKIRCDTRTELGERMGTAKWNTISSEIKARVTSAVCFIQCSQTLLIITLNRLEFDTPSSTATLTIGLHTSS